MYVQFFYQLIIQLFALLTIDSKFFNYTLVSLHFLLKLFFLFFCLTSVYLTSYQFILKFYIQRLNLFSIELGFFQRNLIFPNFGFKLFSCILPLFRLN